MTRDVSPPARFSKNRLLNSAQLEIKIKLASPCTRFPTVPTGNGAPPVNLQLVLCNARPDPRQSKPRRRPVLHTGCIFHNLHGGSEFRGKYGRKPFACDHELLYSLPGPARPSSRQNMILIDARRIRIWRRSAPAGPFDAQDPPFSPRFNTSFGLCLEATNGPLRCPVADSFEPRAAHVDAPAK